MDSSPSLYSRPDLGRPGALQSANNTAPLGYSIKAVWVSGEDACMPIAINCYFGITAFQDNEALLLQQGGRLLLDCAKKGIPLPNLDAGSYLHDVRLTTEIMVSNQKYSADFLWCSNYQNPGGPTKLNETLHTFLDNNPQIAPFGLIFFYIFGPRHEGDSEEEEALPLSTRWDGNVKADWDGHMVCVKRDPASRKFFVLEPFVAHQDGKLLYIELDLNHPKGRGGCRRFPANLRHMWIWSYGLMDVEPKTRRRRRTSAELLFAAAGLLGPEIQD